MENGGPPVSRACADTVAAFGYMRDRLKIAARLTVEIVEKWSHSVISPS